MEKRVSFPRRYLTFFVIGCFVEAVRLVAFWFFLKRLESALVANFVSVPFGVLAAFLLHTTVTWFDRSGSYGGKFARFGANKGVTTLAKWVIFPFWSKALPCPFYNLTHRIFDFLIRALPFLVFSRDLVTCEWMAVASMDQAIALTLGFGLHDRISFAPEGVVDWIPIGSAATGAIVLGLVGTLGNVWTALGGIVVGFCWGMFAGSKYAIHRTRKRGGFS